MLRIQLFSAILVATISIAHGAELVIQKPENDRLVMTPTVDVEGTGSPDGSAVKVTINGSSTNTTVSGGKWSVKNLHLNVGANTIQVNLGDKSASILTVRGTGTIAKRPSQKVRFLWNAGVDDELKKLARTSLSTALTEQQLADFASAVKLRAVEVFKGRYEGIADIQITTSDGDDVHTISMLAIESDVFGQSPPDCGNTKLKQVSEVHVGTYRAQMTDAMELRWGPMKMGDSVSVRIEDVGQALGRTSAHEFGHSLGLVGQPGDVACFWMDGCDGGHNCDVFDANHQPLANRFNNGWHIMDPGGKTENNARLAEPDKDKRAAQRRPAIFDSFGLSYLRLIHPLP